MEVSFDTEKHNGAGAPVTRIYAPSHRNGPEVRMIEEAAENLPVYPQPREKDLEAEQAVELPKPKVPVYSRILMILAVFLIAGTAILGHQRQRPDRQDLHGDPQPGQRDILLQGEDLPAPEGTEHPERLRHHQRGQPERGPGHELER